MFIEEDFPNLIEIAEKNKVCEATFNITKIGKWQIQLLLTDMERLEFRLSVKQCTDEMLAKFEEKEDA